jgi:radical SAM superfamily enzyme YgiQ (UPF0313 family)
MAPQRRGVSVRIRFIEPAPPGFHIYSFVKQVRLGLPLLATMLRDEGHDVSVHVETLGEMDWDRILDADLVGISTITSTAMKAYRYAERVREAGIPVVMGGPHVTFEADEALEFSDYVVRGEGEFAIFEVLEVLSGARDPEDVAGLSWRDREGVTRHNPARPLLSTTAGLPAPDLSLVEYHDKIDPTPILTSRGCPHDCEFCSVIMMFGRRVRVDPEEAVLGSLRRERPDRVFFYDDNFVLSKRRTKSLLARMIREGLQVHFSAQIRVDSVYKGGKTDHELLGLLAEAGCFLVYLGLESANPETLKGFNKRQSVDDMAGGLAALRSYGIRSHGMFVLGSDNDTVESIRETVDFAIESDISSVQFLALTPLPGTRQTARLRAEGRIFTKNWSLYDGHHVVFWPRQMTPWELQREILESHRRFYRVRRWPGNPKHRLQGFLVTHGWERVPENMAYMRELRAFCRTHEPPPPVAVDPVDAPEPAFLVNSH